MRSASWRRPTEGPGAHGGKEIRKTVYVPANCSASSRLTVSRPRTPGIRPYPHPCLHRRGHTPGGHGGLRLRYRLRTEANSRFSDAKVAWTSRRSPTLHDSGPGSTSPPAFARNCAAGYRGIRTAARGLPGRREGAGDRESVVSHAVDSRFGLIPPRRRPGHPGGGCGERPCPPGRKRESPRRSILFRPGPQYTEANRRAAFEDAARRSRSASPDDPVSCERRFRSTGFQGLDRQGAAPAYLLYGTAPAGGVPRGRVGAAAARRGVRFETHHWTPAGPRPGIPRDCLALPSFFARCASSSSRTSRR